MSQYSTVLAGVMTVPSAGGATTTSNVLDFTVIGDAEDICIHGPAALSGAASAVLEVSPNGTVWTTLQSGGSDVAMPVVGKAIVLDALAFMYARIKTNAAVTTQDSSWTVVKRILA